MIKLVIKYEKCTIKKLYTGALYYNNIDIKYTNKNSDVIYFAE